MKLPGTIPSASGLSLRLLLSLLIFSGGCKVHFIPDYSVALSQDIISTAKKIDNFYLAMQEVNSANRQYEHFTDKYVDIEADLNSLLNQNRIRPLNKESTRISEIALQFWIKYKTEHKSDNKISDGIIKLNRKTFSDLFYAMQVAEEAKNIPNMPNS